MKAIVSVVRSRMRRPVRLFIRNPVVGLSCRGLCRLVLRQLHDPICSHVRRRDGRHVCRPLRHPMRRVVLCHAQTVIVDFVWDPEMWI